MKTFVSNEKLQEIIQKYPTPFHLYTEKGIRRTARKLLAAFSWNRGFKEYFAVKATPTPAILDILKQEGCGVDCSSYTELILADMAGFSGNDIMFSSNVTPKEDFQLARNLHSIINLDDITHIDFLEKTAGIPETICCRYNPGSSFTVNNHIMDNPADAKYGFTKPQLFEGFRSLLKKGAKYFGIHAFLTSNTIQNEYYPLLAEILCKLVVELREETGAEITFINLSGGIGIPYKPNEQPVDIEHIGNQIKSVFDRIMVPSGLGNVALNTELGRYMLGPNGCLVTTATHKKDIHKSYIGVDACAADLMRPAMYKAYHHITVAGKENEPLDHTYDITGGLCENNDKFAIDRAMPKIEIGDTLIIHDTGAHGHSMGYNYNGKLRSAEILLKEDGTIQCIRRAESIKDYFSTLDCAPEVFDIGKKYF